MIPDASEITRRRLTASMLIRMLAVVVLHGSAVPIMIVSVLVVDGEIDPSFSDIAPFFVAAAFPAGVAVAVWCLAPWAARLMIRVPRVPVCPNCRYRLEGLMAPQCIECGYTLTPEFLTTSAERAGGVSEPDTVLLRQIATLVMRLVAGVLVPASAIASFANAISAIERPQWNTWTPVFAWCAVFMFTAGVFLSASRLSFVLVPGRRAFQKRSVPTADTAEPRAPEPTGPLAVTPDRGESPADRARIGLGDAPPPIG